MGYPGLATSPLLEGGLVRRRLECAAAWDCFLKADTSSDPRRTKCHSEGIPERRRERLPIWCLQELQAGSVTGSPNHLGGAWCRIAIPGESQFRRKYKTCREFDPRSCLAAILDNTGRGNSARAINMS